MSNILYKELSYQIQGAIFEIYKTLGNNFKEIVYHRALIDELHHRNLNLESQKRISIRYKNCLVGMYVPDLIVEDKVLIEIKAKPIIIQRDLKQFWYYLKGSPYRLGYLVNFGSFGKAELLRRVYDIVRKR